MSFNIKREYKLFFILFIIWVIFDLKTSLQQFKHSCSMTSMWRNPKFYSLYDDKRLKYDFFLYGEGWYFHDLVESHYFDGIPIVFVPGNAADGAMVRSIGSILQNKTERLNSPFTFNVFSTHFNEEFSIFDANVLKRQAQFLIDSLVELEKLYGNRRKKKYILMGHSMGGIVIKMALAESEWLRKNVAFILTMGTGLKDHPLKITREFIEIYDKILSLKTVPVISLHGGFMDELVEESLTKDNNSLTFGYQGMDRVWSMADHKCLVWCNEAQRAISRLFFDYATIPENAMSTKKLDSLVETIFNSSTFTYNNIEKGKLDEVFNYVEKQLINEGNYFFAIGKVDSSFPLIYKSKKEGRINLFPAKTYFYSRQMKYVYSLEVIGKDEDYYVNKNANIKIIKNNDVEKLSPSVLKEKIKFTDVKGNVKVFIIPFRAPEFIYKITLKSTNNEMSKLLFKAGNQQSISMNNKLMLNFFDGNTKSDGTLFVISNPKTFFSNLSHTEYELDYKIDIGLTILRAIKLNISNIPFLLSFMGVLFSYDVNNLYKLLSLQIIFYVVTNSIVSTIVLLVLGIVIIHCLKQLGEALITVSEILSVNNGIGRIYRWIFRKVSCNLIIVLFSLSSLFYQPLYLIYSLISLIISPNIVMFFISLSLYFPTYFIFYQSPDLSFSFKGNRLYEWSGIIQLLSIYLSSKKNTYISPWIFSIPHWILITFNTFNLTVWEYVIMAQAISISLMFFNVKKIKTKTL